jgi:hypothetical protein
MRPWLLPSGLPRGIPFIIPDDWSAEQSLAVIELLDDLREVIWRRYQHQLQKELRKQRAPKSSFNSVIDETKPPFQSIHTLLPTKGPIRVPWGFYHIMLRH